MENITETLRDKQNRLTQQLEACTDSKSYDTIAAQLADVTKTLHLETAREKKRIADEAEAVRKKKMADRMALIEKIGAEKKIRVKLDADLFAKIEEVFNLYSQAYENSVQIVMDTKALRFSSEELQLPEPEKEKAFVCGMYDPMKSKEELLLLIINQYDQAAAQLADSRRRNEKNVPSRPELSWYSKGDGRYWDGSIAAELQAQRHEQPAVGQTAEVKHEQPTATAQ